MNEGNQPETGRHCNFGESTVFRKLIHDVFATPPTTCLEVIKLLKGFLGFNYEAELNSKRICFDGFRFDAAFPVSPSIREVSSAAVA